MKIRTCVHIAALAALGNLAVASVGLAHQADGRAASSATSNPATLVQLETVQRATDRFLDVQRAINEGYVDIGVFYSNMGHHYLRADLLDATFELEHPEILVYADDPCGGGRRLVAVEYAVPLALAADAPVGFAGPNDAWVINQTFQLWTLHAWLFEYNPAGVFASHNMRLP